MKNLQKLGGIAALYEAAGYILGMVGFLFIEVDTAVVDPVEKATMVVDNQVFLSVILLILSGKLPLLFGLCLEV